MKKISFLALLLFSFAVNAEEGSTSDIHWGQHWAGPELRGAKSLEGKVVLLKIWGG